MEEKISFKLAEGVKPPLRVVVAPGGVNRIFESEGPHECTPAEWPSLESSVVTVNDYEQNAGGEQVIVGRRTVRAFERIEPPRSKLRVFGGRKEED